jgi:hypothetical protein
VSSGDNLENLAASSEPAPEEGDDQHTRREAGARRETSEPLVFYREKGELEGWALNVSGGGLRAILDEPLEVGEELELGIGGATRRSVRVVWIRKEKGGAIVGLAFTDQAPGSVPPPPDSSPPSGADEVATPSDENETANDEAPEGDS